MCTGLDSSLQSLSKDMQSSMDKLSEALKQRKNFEENFLKCQTWLNEAETSVASDVKGSSNIEILEEQLAKV
jgi:hypothetical protein